MQTLNFSFARTVPTLALALVLVACSGDADGDGGGPAPDVLPQLPTLALAEAPVVAAETAILTVSVDEASALIAAEAPVVVLDVRTPDEFAQGHIEGAINVDAMSETFVEDLASLDKDASYVVHCRSGRRSAKAVEAMEKADFTRVAHMDAGMNGWNEAGLPVTQ